MLRRVTLGLLLAGMAGAAFAQASAIRLDAPQLRASLGATPTTAAYLTIRNTGATADRLMGASCDCARTVSVHQTTHTGGVARMAEEKAVTIPAAGQVVFAPGGRHLMLMGLKAPLRAGDKATITLRFEKAGAVRAVFTATDTPGAAAAAAGGHQHH